MLSSSSLVSCDTCHEQFVSGPALDQHLREAHDDARPFLCHLCPAKFRTVEDLQTHVETCKGARNQPPTSNVNYKSIAPLENGGMSNIAAPYARGKTVRDMLGGKKEKVKITMNERGGNTVANLYNKQQQLLTQTAAMQKRTVGSNLNQIQMPQNAVVSKEMLQKLISSGKVVLPSSGGSMKLAGGNQVIKMVQIRPGSMPVSMGSGLRMTLPAGLTSGRQLAPRLLTTTGQPMSLPVGTGAPRVPPMGMQLPQSSSVLVPPRAPMMTNLGGLGAAGSGTSLQSALEPFRCSTDGCDGKFASIPDLESHINDSHSGKEHILQCHLCIMKFKRIPDLEEHVKSFVCPVDAAGKWKGFGSMPSLPKGALDILDYKINEGPSLPVVSELPGLKFQSQKMPSPIRPPVKDFTPLPPKENVDLDETTLGEQLRQKQPQVCNVCSKTFVTLNEFTMHYRQHVGKLMPPVEEVRPSLKYQCTSCPKSFADFDQLFIHGRVHTGETPYACRYCDCAFVDVNGLQYHMFMVHPASVNRIKLLKCRVANIHPSKSYQQHCSGKFFDVRSLREHHMIAHAGRDEYPCQCDSCSLVCQSVDELEKHIKSQVCNVLERISEWLTETPDAHAHLATNVVLRKDSIPTLKVKTQNSVFNALFQRKKNGTSLNGKKGDENCSRELRVVLERRPTCPRCQDRFSCLSGLMLHFNKFCTGRIIRKKRTPSKRKNRETRMERKSRLFCVDCRLFFKNDESFHTHNTTKHRETFKETTNAVKNPIEALEAKKKKQEEEDETDGKPVVKRPRLIWESPGKKSDLSKPGVPGFKFQKECQICYQVFTSMDAFIEHYRSHQPGDQFEENKGKVRRFVCQVCNKEFISRGVYNNHMRIHSGETPFACKFCNEATKSEHEMTIHTAHSHFKTKFFRVTEPCVGGTTTKMSLDCTVNEMMAKNYPAIGCSFRCMSCNRKFSNLDDVQDHIQSMECAVSLKSVYLSGRDFSNEFYLCKICGDMFDEDKSLEEHYESSHMF